MSNTMQDAMKKAGVNTSSQGSNKKSGKPAGRGHAPANVSKIVNGKIKWFDFRKGFGWVTADDGNEYFVYHSDISVGRTYIGFEAGDDVSFRLTMNNRTNQMKAANVSLVMDENETKKKKSKSVTESRVIDDQGDRDDEDSESPE